MSDQIFNPIKGGVLKVKMHVVKDITKATIITYRKNPESDKILFFLQNSVHQI